MASTENISKFNFSSFWNGLPGWQKKLMIALIILIIIILVVAIIKKVNKDAQRLSDEALAGRNEEERKQNIEKGMKLSYPPSQYPAFANQIYDGMKYGIGDDYGNVRDTLMKMNNDLDVNELVKWFKTRQSYVFGIPQGDPKDMFTMVKSELGSEWGGLYSGKLKAVNDDWKKKGIKYSF